MQVSGGGGQMVVWVLGMGCQVLLLVYDGPKRVHYSVADGCDASA